jgi:hypothetical protein
MSTNTHASRRRVSCLLAGAALAVAASGAAAFPFFDADNSTSDSTIDEPSFGLALNNAFDPLVLFVTFVDVEVELVPGSMDTNNIGLFDPQDAETLIASGNVEFTYGEVDDVTGVFMPTTDVRTGFLDLTLENLQYDAAGNFFFINGPMAAMEPGNASGELELTGVSGVTPDFSPTPGFDESTQCTNFDGYMGPGPPTDSRCVVNLGLDPGNTTPQVVKFFPSTPILIDALPGLECFDFGQGTVCFISEGFEPPATLPTGQIIGSFDHGACDPADDENTTDLPPDRVACAGFWDQPINVGPAGKFTAFTADRVPAPASLALLGLGLVLVAGARRLA